MVNHVKLIVGNDGLSGGRKRSLLQNAVQTPPTPHHPLAGAARLISSSCIAGCRVGSQSAGIGRAGQPVFRNHRSAWTHTYPKRSHARNTCLPSLVSERMDTHTHVHLGQNKRCDTGSAGSRVELHAHFASSAPSSSIIECHQQRQHFPQKHTHLRGHTYTGSSLADVLVRITVIDHHSRGPHEPGQLDFAEGCFFRPRAWTISCECQDGTSKRCVVASSRKNTELNRRLVADREAWPTYDWQQSAL